MTWRVNIRPHVTWRFVAAGMPFPANQNRTVCTKFFFSYKERVKNLATKVAKVQDVNRTLQR